jgi:hypothetical protein
MNIPATIAPVAIPQSAGNFEYAMTSKTQIIANNKSNRCLDRNCFKARILDWDDAERN